MLYLVMRDLQKHAGEYRAMHRLVRRLLKGNASRPEPAKQRNCSRPVARTG